HVNFYHSSSNSHLNLNQYIILCLSFIDNFILINLFFLYYSRTSAIYTLSLHDALPIFRIWQPVVMGQKPFSWAHSRCSRAFFRLPGYRVLQSVKKGMPPCSLHRSATTLA